MREDPASSDDGNFLSREAAWGFGPVTVHARPLLPRLIYWVSVHIARELLLAGRSTSHLMDARPLAS